MNDKLFDQYTKRTKPDDSRSEPDGDDTDTRGCFGWLRGIRDRAVSLELRKKDGFILAIGYSWLGRMEYEPSRGITLFAPGQKILITGTGLNAEIRPTVRLFEGLARHRVPWIREAESGELLKPDANATMIEGIQWED